MKKNMANLHVTKASGDLNAYSEETLRKSLYKCGASAEQVNGIIDRITPQLYDGISTADIYKEAYRLLRAVKNGPAARYKLKNAIKELGPTGFPFEQYIGRLFKAMGYNARTNNTVRGKCVTHEVDVIAWKDTEQHLVECKFHQMKGTLCDVKIPLYISARFGDIRAQMILEHKPEAGFQGWVVTNTRFTKDAAAYGICSGLKLMGWDFPDKESLKVLIDRYNLYPVTSLSTLSAQEKLQLLSKNIVLCSEILSTPGILENIVSPARVPKVMDECQVLLSPFQVTDASG